MCTHDAHRHGIDCEAIHTPYIYVYGDRYTRVQEAIQILPPSISEGGSLHSPINTLTMVHTLYVTILGKNNQLAGINFIYLLSYLSSDDAVIQI